jgi:hypothetical protein
MESESPISLKVIHHRQNPIETTSNSIIVCIFVCRAVAQKWKSIRESLLRNGSISDITDLVECHLFETWAIGRCLLHSLFHNALTIAQVQ